MIKVGDRVRSFDFVGELNDGTRTGRDLGGDRACFVEGVVELFVEREGCPRYEIRVERDVFGGCQAVGSRVGDLVYPPVNGTPTLFGSVCDNVELL